MELGKLIQGVLKNYEVEIQKEVWELTKKERNPYNAYPSELKHKIKGIIDRIISRYLDKARKKIEAKKELKAM